MLPLLEQLSGTTLLKETCCQITKSRVTEENLMPITCQCQSCNLDRFTKCLGCGTLFTLQCEIKKFCYDQNQKQLVCHNTPICLVTAVLSNMKNKIFGIKQEIIPAMIHKKKSDDDIDDFLHYDSDYDSDYERGYDGSLCYNHDSEDSSDYSGEG